MTYKPGFPILTSKESKFLLNKQTGIRLGTPALTTRGMKEGEMRLIAAWLDTVIANQTNESVLSGVKKDIAELCRKFPLYV